jgi:DNA-directed RNA polymerase specialized sigma subunit
MDYIRESIERLRDYNALVASIKNLEEQLKAVEAEKTSIKSLQISFAPGGGGAEPDERLVNAIFNSQVLKNNYGATKRRIECIDRALEELDDRERKVLNRMYIVGGKNGVNELMNEFYLSSAQVYRIRDTGLRKFARAMFGIGVT